MAQFVKEVRICLSAIVHFGDLWVNKDNVSFLQQLDLKK